jgi:hypothetical protein
MIEKRKEKIEPPSGAAWSRFERAVDVVAKSPPQHRSKDKNKSETKRTISKPTESR